MDQAPADMKSTMDLKDHSPIELTWAKDQGHLKWTKHQPTWTRRIWKDQAAPLN
jgi:hypothetical protein